MKQSFLLAALLFSAGLVSAAPSGPDDGSDVFLLDTLSLSSARAVDSVRAAAAPRDSAPVAALAGEEPTAALAGTPEGQGSISGKVISEARGTAVPGARVIVAGRNLSADTDADGRFGFPGLPPGIYSLFLYHASYAPLTADSVRVVAGRDASRRFPLPDKAVQGEAVRVTGSATQASDAGMLFARKNSPAVSDGISSEQISKSPDADAAAALKRVTGISIAGDGLVYVRGLGERYVNMQLNGMTVSSPNPEKRVVPLDMFPTRLLENLSVAKTFTPDQPAEFAGGSLQLRTRDYPDKRLIEVSASAGYDPGSTFEDYLTYKGGKWDWIGVDDGTRKLPAIVPDGYFDESSPNLGTTPEQQRAAQQRILAALPNIWTPYARTAPLNQSYGLTMGNKIPVGDGQIVGWLLGASYSAKAGSDEETVGRIRIEGEDSVVYRDQSTNEISTESVQWGTLATVSWRPNARHKLRANFLMNRDWEDQVTRVFGMSEGESDTSLVFELANAQQTLLNGQLEGEHVLNEDGLKLTWLGAFTNASRLEPDRRVSKYFVMRPTDPLYNPDFPFFVGATQGLQDRFWFDLRESGGGGKTDLEVPVDWGLFSEGSKVRSGLYAFGKSRDYRVRRVSYQPGGALTGSSLGYGNTYEDYFGAFNGGVDSGYVHTKNEKEKDDYSVEDRQWAAHVQGDWILNESWRFIAGFRLMNATVEGHATSDPGALSPDETAQANCSPGRCDFNFGYDETAVLPAVSLVHAVTESQNARVAYARTFSFPEYREMAPLLFYSYQNAEEVVGNVDL